MTSVMQPLKDEHQQLLPHIESLREAGILAGSATGQELLSAVTDAHDFLVHQLIPHAQAEDRVLYPAVERVMGAPGAADTMRRDHLGILDLTRQLGDLRVKIEQTGASEADVRELQRLLFGLYGIVKLHFEKEEEIYVPLLEKGLSQAEASAMFEAMEAAAAEARASAHV